MMWKKYTGWIILVVLAVTIKLFSLFPAAVETYYSNGLYPVVATVQRILLGWIPFSVGDLFYAAMGLLLVYKLGYFIRRLTKRTLNRQYWLTGLRQLALATLLVYVFFNALWGLNYNRVGIAHQLNLTVAPYSKQDLVAVVGEIVHHLNEYDSLAHQERLSLKKKRFLFKEALAAYDSLAARQPVMAYNWKSVKPSLFSYLGNYLGFTGYYNPFSGEAQVNTTVPLFIQPFTTCHEIGHQLGYAKENEANFAGYLSARSSRNATFRYSVYFDLYAYSRFYLYVMDTTLAKSFDEQLRPGVRQDYRELREFSRRHRTVVEYVIDKLYGKYLMANQQPSGRLTYNEVIAWLVAYYKKYGREAI